MHSINLSDEIYNRAKNLAEARGFASVEELISGVLEEESAIETENYDHLFTPEVLAAIDGGIADIAAGRTFTAQELEERTSERREAWPKERAS